MFQMQAVPKWTAPSGVSQALRGDASSCQLCSDFCGNLVAVWRQCLSDSESVVYAATCVDDAWQAPVQLSQTGFSSTKPCICCNREGNIFVAWVQQSQEDDSSKICLTEYTKSCKSCTTEPICIPAQTQVVDNPKIWCDAQGCVNVVWQEYDDVDPSLSKIMVAGYVPGQHDFVFSPEEVTAGVAIIDSLQVCCNVFGQAIIVWQQETNENQIYVCAACYERGKCIDGPRFLSVANTSAFNPHVCCDSRGNAFVVWSQYKATSKFLDIYGVKYKPGQPSEPFQISKALGSANAEIASVCSCPTGDVLVAWKQTWHGVNTLYVSKYALDTLAGVCKRIATAPVDQYAYYRLHVWCCSADRMGLLWMEHDVQNDRYSIQGAECGVGNGPTWRENISGYFYGTGLVPEYSTGQSDGSIHALWPEQMGEIKSTCLSAHP